MLLQCPALSDPDEVPMDPLLSRELWAPHGSREWGPRHGIAGTAALEVGAGSSGACSVSSLLK